jgi:hypothetical protein
MELSLLRSKFSARALALVFAPLLVVGSLGCGRTNKVYPDRSSTGTNAQGDDTVSADGRDLPKNFVNQSANLGSAVLTSEKRIELKTLAGTKTEGSFNGAGTGSLAVLGLTAYDQTRLSDLSTLTLEFKKTFGTANFSAVLLIDLECDFKSGVRALFAENLTGVEDDFKTVDISSHASVWKVKSADLKGPQDQVLVSATTPGSLDALLTIYPNACLRNAKSDEPSLPKTQMAGLALTLGSPTTVDQNHVLVRRIEIGTRVYDSSNWGS